jgi:hypothetical protein
MRTNRLISRTAAAELELQQRIELEARVTDALGGQYTDSIHPAGLDL